MQKKYALYLTDSTLILCTVASTGVDLVFSQEITEPEFETTFKDCLSQLDIAELAIFLDLIGEEYKHESIPHVGGKDREMLMSRKQQSLFPTADLIWKNHLEREKTGRKDDVFLLMGIQLPHSVKTIFKLLIQHEQPVTGVYSISVLESEIQKIIPNKEQYLTVSRVLGENNSGRSYRQTFNKNQEIDISRVTRAKGEDFDEVLNVLMKEIERMHHF